LFLFRPFPYSLNALFLTAASCTRKAFYTHLNWTGKNYQSVIKMPINSY